MGYFARYSPDVCIDCSGFLADSQPRPIGMLSLPTLFSLDALLKEFFRGTFKRLFSPCYVRLRLHGTLTSHLAWRIHIVHTSVAMIHGTKKGNHFHYIHSVGAPRFWLPATGHGLWHPRKLSARECARDVSSIYIYITR